MWQSCFPLHSSLRGSRSIWGRELACRKDHLQGLVQILKIAVKELLVGKHVLAVLPTGYRKSLIFTLFLLAREEMSRRLDGACGSDCIGVLVVCSIRSIISDQIAEMISLGCSAVELSTETLSENIRSPPQFIYSSAESAIMRGFLNGLMKSCSPLHRSLLYRCGRIPYDRNVDRAKVSCYERVHLAIHVMCAHCKLNLLLNSCI